MIARLLTVLIAVVLPASHALAHGPTPQSAEQSIAIDASADSVWAILKEFGSLASWHPLVAACTAQGNERTITLKSGGDLVDSLDEIAADERSYTYRLIRENVEAFPVSFYAATIAVKSTGERSSEVTWKASFYRGDTHNEPPENLSDAAAVAAMTEFISVGLRGLKSKVE
jgi:mxaD protein